MTIQDLIDEAALKAACLTRYEYNQAGYNQILCYDIARDSAADRGYDLCINIDIDPRPANIGAALLRLVDDLRVEAGLPRIHQQAYLPRIIQTPA
jgi:TnpA family transposase